MLIAAKSADPNGILNAGEIYVVFGKADGYTASLNLSVLNGINGFVMRGIDAGDWSGYSVSGASQLAMADVISSSTSSAVRPLRRSTANE